MPFHFRWASPRRRSGPARNYPLVLRGRNLLVHGFVWLFHDVDSTNADTASFSRRDFCASSSSSSFYFFLSLLLFLFCHLLFLHLFLFLFQLLFLRLLFLFLPSFILLFFFLRLFLFLYFLLSSLSSLSAILPLISLLLFLLFSSFSFPISILSLFVFRFVSILSFFPFFLLVAYDLSFVYFSITHQIFLIPFFLLFSSLPISSVYIFTLSTRDHSSTEYCSQVSDKRYNFLRIGMEDCLGRRVALLLLAIEWALLR